MAALKASSMAVRATQCCLWPLLAGRGLQRRFHLSPAFRTRPEWTLSAAQRLTVRQRWTWGHGGCGVRTFCSALSGSDDDGDREAEEEVEGEYDEEGALGLEGVSHSHLQAVTTISVPEVFPEVPVLPISRNPIFPRFVKMLEVCGTAGPSPST